MPDITVRGTFKPDPSYNHVEEVERSIQMMRKYLDNQLSIIDNIGDQTMQLICMFSLIDCLAQEWAGYPTGKSKEAFCKFVLQHQSKYDYLDGVEPVTLHYHVEDLIKESDIEHIESIASLKTLCISENCLAKHAIKTVKAKMILEYLEKIKNKDFALTKAKEHQLITLIYRMRSKATHEMTGLGEKNNTLMETKLTEPFYRNVLRGYVLDDKIVSEFAYELVIPNIFIRDLLMDCINGYLIECKIENKLPFGNNSILRKHRLTWYDK